MTGPEGGDGPGKRRTALKPTRVSASRKVVLRDFAIFQVKLILDGFKDVVLSAVSLVALAVDLLAGGGRRPRVFYSVLAMSERFDAWLNLSGAVTRLEQEELDDDGLFAASESGSDSLLGRIEEMVRGGDRPPGSQDRPEPRSPGPGAGPGESTKD